MSIERVACVPRGKILGRGFWRESGEMDALSDHVSFIPRHKDDPKGIESPWHLGEHFLQLVAYVVPRCRDLVFVYNRAKGSDPRLAGRLSIAFGGHVNLGDWRESGGLESTLIGAAWREAQEECPELRLEGRRPAGLIYVPGTGAPVERVHLGVVFPAKVDSPVALNVADESIDPIGWMSPALALKQFPARFEAWSEVILNSLSFSGDKLL